MSTQFVSNESIVILNDNFQYEPNNQVENAKWLDTQNVMSVKRDKTIYAVRARNNFDFTQGRNNSSFFANTTGSSSLEKFGGDYDEGVSFSSNIYRGFNTSLNGTAENIFMTAPANVYGNLSANANISTSLLSLGIGGSLLDTNFVYNINSETINVQSNVRVMGNLGNIDMSAHLPSAFFVNAAGNVMTEQTADGSRFANVNGNTAYYKLFYNDNEVTQWNRLINANLSGNIMVTASCDPCDHQGNANPISLGGAGTSSSNEAYRHQFQLRTNSSALAKQNPIYIARVSRFGKSISDNQNGNIVSRVSMHSFTGNFAACIPSDNSLYAGANVITGINITGNISMPSVVVINSNFTTGNLVNPGGFNGVATNNLAPLSNNSRFINITDNVGSSVADYVAGGDEFAYANNGNIKDTGRFADGDRVGVVQANVALNTGYMLLDRISFRTSDPAFIRSSRVFSGANNLDQTDFTTSDRQTVTAIYGNLWFQSNMLTNTLTSEISAKYLVIKGTNVIGNNWQTVSLMTPNSVVMPTVTGNPNLEYLQPGNLVNLYLRRGQLSMDNYTYVNNKTLTGVKYLSSVPSFVQNVSLPLNNIVLSENIFDPIAVSDNMHSLNLPLVSGATRVLQSNVTNNYNFVFSGNANVDQRVNLRSNVVCPVNFANSFIANCWNYDTTGVDIFGQTYFTADIENNVSLIYGNFPVSITVDNVTRQVQTLSLNSEMSKYNIEYEVDFVRSTGSTNASSDLTQNNFVFYANVDSSGSKPNVNYTNNSQVLSSVLNNNENINGMHLPGVAYSEYSFSDQSFKFTDLGNVLGSLDLGFNWNVKTILPSAVTNSDDGTNTTANQSNQDSFLNIITDYLNFQNLSGESTDIHQVTCSNFAYRYSILGVTSPGQNNINNSIMVGDETFDPDTLYNTLGADNVNPTVSGSVRASVASCYVYENVDNTTAPEQLYPFVIPDSDNSLPTNSTVSNLFPGFEWRAISGGFSFFQQKTSNTVNFVLPNNGLTSQNFALTINSDNTVDGTMKVGLTYGTTVINPRTIRIVPIQHGMAVNGVPVYATPIVCGVQDEPNTYVIIMVECNSNSATGVNGGLSNAIRQNYPATINISTIEKTSTGFNQISAQAYLRVFDSNNTLRTDIQDNYSFKAPLSMFNFAPSGNGNNLSTELSLNIFSAPPNNAIISIIYEQSVINKVLSFSRTDYLLNDRFTGYVTVPVNSSAVNFASSLSNPSLVSALDDNRLSNPSINPLSTRYYIEGFRSGIWIDVRNDAVIATSQMGVLRVDRSVEWRLTRTWNNNTEQVGRGLLSKNSVNAATTSNNYLIFENLPGFAGSGYAHSIRANLNDLSTRLLLQRLQTNANIINNVQNRNNWLINSLSDQINIMLVNMDPTTNLPRPTNALINTANVRLTRSGDSIDLGALFVQNPLLSSQYAGTLGVISLSSIRGFGVNLNAQRGEVDIPSSMFSYNIQPDCYSLVHINRRAQFGGDVLTQFNVLFTEEINVDSFNANSTIASVQMTLSLDSASLAYQYLDVTSPLLSNSFVQIGTYTHNGYGQIEYYIKDFVSNYDTELPSEVITDEDITDLNFSLNPFGNSALESFQVNNVLPTEAPTRVVNIKYDPSEASDEGKFYFNLDESVRPLNPSDRVYFRGTGLDSLPTQINNHTTLLLYTGLRPMVLNVVQVATSDVSLADLIDSTLTFNWNPSSTNDVNIFTDLSLDVVTSLGGIDINRQFYQVVLTNLSAANNNQSIRFRANRYAPTSAWLLPFNADSNPNRNFFGTYVNASNLLNSLRLNISRQSNINTVFTLASKMRTPLENPQKSDDDIISGAILNRPFTATTDNLLINSGSAAFTISGQDDNHATLGELFTFTIQGVLNSYESGDGAGFRITVNPSNLTLYTALDTNNNGEIDTNVNQNVNDIVDGLSTNFKLNSMFSELNFKLPFGQTQFLKPAALSTTVLNREFIPVPGAPFDILLNNRWAVGYNLDCFFTIRNNIAAEFDVITIDTRATTNPDGSDVTNLLVNAGTAPLVVANPNEWARSIQYGTGFDGMDNSFYNSPSGLTFKLNSATEYINAGEVVRLYVDNTIANNTLEWNVSVAGNTSRTYQLYSYDQDRYAALLDEQLAIRNKFVNEN